MRWQRKLHKKHFEGNHNVTSNQAFRVPHKISDHIVNSTTLRMSVTECQTSSSIRNHHDLVQYSPDTVVVI